MKSHSSHSRLTFGAPHGMAHAIPFHHLSSQSSLPVAGRAPPLVPSAAMDRMLEVEANVDAGPSPVPSSPFLQRSLQRDALQAGFVVKLVRKNNVPALGDLTPNKPLAGNPRGLRLLFWEPRKAVDDTFRYLLEHSILLFPRDTNNRSLGSREMSQGRHWAALSSLK